MEALAVEKTASPPSKKIKNPKRNTSTHPLYPLHVQHNYYPPPSMKQGMVFMHGIHGGAVFSNPRSSPSSPYSRVLLSYSSLPPYTYLQNQNNNNNNNPPLLPLPDVSKPAFLSLPPLSSSAHTLSKRKQQPRQQHKAMKKTTPNTPSTVANKPNDVVQAQPSEVKRAGGSDPGKDPKEATRVRDDVKEESSVLFSMCPPPPSSLPMPKFSLLKQQPKLISCTVEAVSDEIDDGASDKLRRLLRLR